MKRGREGDKKKKLGKYGCRETDRIKKGREKKGKVLNI